MMESFLHEGLQKWHEKNGFDAFFITDHNHHQKTLEAVKAQEQGMLPGEPLMMRRRGVFGQQPYDLAGT